MQKLLLIVLAVCAVSAQAFQFEKVMPFATADSVRIDIVGEGKENLTDVEITGKIVQIKTGQTLWEGPLGKLDSNKFLTHAVGNLKPVLWEPTAPNLYSLEVTATQQGRALATHKARFGFRSFEQRNGQFYLNSRKTFLRGIAINPPGRTIPDTVCESRAFAEDYVRDLLSQHVNIIRLSQDSQVWFDVCDELGMMIFQGRYGNPLESDSKKKSPPANFESSIKAYKDLFGAYTRHPSIVIYVLSNELPTRGKQGKAFSEFLTKACATLESWDHTRQYIGNAGYGEGIEGDICDVHRYWGWYYNTFLTFYNLRNNALVGDAAKNQPITFSECVGNFTGPNGEYNIIMSKQLGAQLNWTGYSANQRDDAAAHQTETIREVTESFRRLRPLNRRISGLMPFTIFFYNWRGITSFAEMKPNPGLDQLGVSYQPVLLSWELWTSQLYAGSPIHAVAHVIDDADDGSALNNATLQYELLSPDGKTVLETNLPLASTAYYETRQVPVNFTLPAELATGEYVLSGKIVSGDREISHNQAKIFIAGDSWKKEQAAPAKKVLLYDTTGLTAAALKKIGVPFEPISDLTKLNQTDVLVIGENSVPTNFSSSRLILKQYLHSGGRVLCLQQESGKMDIAWLPNPIKFFTSSPNDATYPVASRPFKEEMSINLERPDHPVFAGLDRHRLSLWSDYTGWTQSHPGFPKIYPVTAGFALETTGALAKTAILADYDRGLEGVALCEMFFGQGSVILSAFDLVKHAGLDPAADRLLVNLINYTASTDTHYAHPLIEKPILWGNYPTERGLIGGPLNGFIVNADWIAPPTEPKAKPLTQAQGEWNSKPGDQFVPHGRSPYGVYEYSTSSALRSGNTEEKIGSAIFWARLPEKRRQMITKVKNPEKTAAQLSVTVNSSTSPGTSIPPGATVTITTPVFGAAEVSVKYTGTKKLVILETAFE